jgi:hypothetical protein
MLLGCSKNLKNDFFQNVNFKNLNLPPDTGDKSIAGIVVTSDQLSPVTVTWLPLEN